MSQEDFTDQQHITLLALQETGSILSVIGSTFIIVTYLKFKPLHKLSFELVFYLSIADLIRSCSNMLFAAPDTGTPLCYIQGFLHTFGGLSSFFWVAVISIVMHSIIYSPQKWDKYSIKKYHKIWHSIVWPLAFILAVLPLTTEYGYGNTGGWCFISHSKHSQVAWSWVSFYIWCWAVLLLIVILYCRLFKYFDNVKNIVQMDDDIEHDELSISSVVSSYSNVEKSENNDDNVELGNLTKDNDVDNKNDTLKQKGLNSTSRMFYYPLVLLICYFFATLRRFWNFTDDDAPFWIVGCRVFFASVYGFGNSIVYGYTIWSWMLNEIKSKAVQKHQKIEQHKSDSGL